MFHVICLLLESFDKVSKLQSVALLHHDLECTHIHTDFSTCWRDRYELVQQPVVPVTAVPHHMDMVTQEVSLEMNWNQPGSVPERSQKTLGVSSWMKNASRNLSI